MRITMTYVRVQEGLRSWWREFLAERDEHGDRGDVPGWVFVTVMTAGLVTVLWAVAGDRLETLLTTALDSVTGN